MDTLTALTSIKLKDNNNNREEYLIGELYLKLSVSVLSSGSHTAEASLSAVKNNNMKTASVITKKINEITRRASHLSLIHLDLCCLI